MNKLCFIYGFITFFLLHSCTRITADEYELRCSEKKLFFSIDSETKLPQKSVYVFSNGHDSTFLSFQNGKEMEILIYNLNSGDIVKKVRFEKEGANSIIGGFGGYYINNNEILIPSVYESIIYVTDTTGMIKQKIDFSQNCHNLVQVDFSVSCPCSWLTGFILNSNLG